DDAASRRDAVDDPGIPPVEFRSQMVGEDNRHSGVGPKLPVDEFRPAYIDAFRRRIFPRDARSRMRLLVHAHIASKSIVTELVCDANEPWTAAMGQRLRQRVESQSLSNTSVHRANGCKSAKQSQAARGRP